MRIARTMAIAFAFCLLLRSGCALSLPPDGRIPHLCLTVANDLGRIQLLLGKSAAERARNWATRVAPLAGAGVQIKARGGVVALKDIEGDLLARLNRGLDGMRRLLLLNLQLSAVRLAALAESLPLGALALAVGAANGWASRHARRQRMEPESAFAFRIALAGAWAAGAWFFAYATVPLRIDPDAAAWVGWALAATATHYILTYFGGRS